MKFLFFLGFSLLLNSALFSQHHKVEYKLFDSDSNYLSTNYSIAIINDSTLLLREYIVAPLNDTTLEQSSSIIIYSKQIDAYYYINLADTIINKNYRTSFNTDIGTLRAINIQFRKRFLTRKILIMQIGLNKNSVQNEIDNFNPLFVLLVARNAFSSHQSRLILKLNPIDESTINVLKKFPPILNHSLSPPVKYIYQPIW